MASLPARGAWIEIQWCQYRHVGDHESLPARGAWIEICAATSFFKKNLSLPARGAWIEIRFWRFQMEVPRVAPREGSVD